MDLTGKESVLIDLDTVMPGLVMNDLVILFVLEPVQQKRMKLI